MSNNIVRFPRRSEDRKRKEAAKGRLSCEVSERWIRFPSASDKFEDMEYLALDIMTLGSNEQDRKLCEIILDKQQLLKMLQELPVNVHKKT